MTYSNGQPRRLGEQHLRAAFELGGDHAEDGLSRRLDADALWELLIDEPRSAFVEEAPAALVRSYEAGYIHLL